LLTKVVARVLPFHFTTEVATNPVPFTVRVNPAPPGAVASGTSGWLVNGTGFCAKAGAATAIRRLRVARNRVEVVRMRVSISIVKERLVVMARSPCEFSY
jgi:hypothetical protein